MFQTIRKKWTSHILPLICVAVAVLMLVLTPVWALEWYHTPFPGLLLEPNNVVSQINGPDWPARLQGVGWSDRLVAINQTRVETSLQIQSVFKSLGFNPVDLTFNRRNGSTYNLTVLLTKVAFQDVFSLFIVPYLVGLIFLGIALWAYRIRPDLRSTRAFVIFVAATAVLTTTFLDMNTSHHVVLLWSLSLPVGAGALGYLALVFPIESKFIERRPEFRNLPWLVSVVLGVITLRDIVFPPTPYSYIDSWRWGYILNALGILVFIFALLIRIFGKSTPVVRQQSRVIVFGAALAWLPVLIFFLLPIGFGGQIPEFRPEFMFPPMIFLPIAVTYAILRFRLLDVDRWLSRALTYVLTTGMALGAFYVVIIALSLILRETARTDNPLVMATYLLFLVVVFTPLRDLIQKGIDRLFYRTHADYRHVLSNLSKSLVVTPDLKPTLALLASELFNALSPQKIVVFLYDDEVKLYLPHGDGADPKVTFAPTDSLPGLLAERKTPLWLPSDGLFPAGLENIANLDCEVFAPLIFEGSLIGFIGIGRRLSGDPYTSDDLDFLSAVANQSSLAFENARLFENLRHSLVVTREMKNLMDNIFASIATGVITTDLEHKITLFNRAAESMLGLSRDSVVGKSLFEALPFLNPVLDTVTSDVIDLGETVRGRELSAHTSQQADLFLRFSAAPLRDANFATKGAAIVLENLTETRKVEAEREVIRQTFGRVVSPRVRDRLLADASNLQLLGTRKTTSVLFADLSGFTSFSEKTSPEIVFKILNTYLDIAAQVILENEGTLDKFMGDAVMAMWNSPDPQPDHAKRACRAALQIVQRSQESHKNFTNPEYHLTFRVGVTTGPAIVGNVGTRQLFNYTVIGDTVNLAQRLQSSAQPGQVYVLKNTIELVKDGFVVEAIQPLNVKGRAQPVEVYLLKGAR